MTILNLAGSATALQFTPSGSFAFSVARDDIIRQAMLNLALLEPSEVPTAQEINDCSRVLNMIVKQLVQQNDRAPGFKMWQRQRGDLYLGYTKYLYNLGSPNGDNFAATVTGLAYPNLSNQSQLLSTVAAGSYTLPLASGNTTGAINIGDFVGVQYTTPQGNPDLFWTTIANYVSGTNIITTASPMPTGSSAGPGAYVFNYTTKAQRPLSILTCLLRDQQGTDTPLNPMTLQEYEQLPTKVQPGYVQDPTAYYYEAQMLGNLGQFYINCSGAQDVSKKLHIVYMREAMDMLNPGDAPEFPQEWFWHLSWTLSLGIHSMFDADWTQGMQETYLLAVTNAREGNPEETANFFQPFADDEG
jgi:hypothetical protein